MSTIDGSVKYFPYMAIPKQALTPKVAVALGEATFLLKKTSDF